MTVLAEVPPEEDRETLPDIVLDGGYFPWRIIRREPGLMFLSPLRKNPPEKVSELRGLDQCRAQAQFRRMVDQISAIEALDRQVEARMRKGTVGDTDLKLVVYDETVPENSVIFKDDSGTIWGPVCLDPLTEPARWPYPGYIKKGEREVQIEPLHGPYVCVKGGVFTMTLIINEALGFAASVANVGWEEAIKVHFPHGMRLTIGGPPNELDCIG